MSNPISESNQPLIQQVNFSERGVEIVFVEPRDVESFDKTGITETRVITCPRDVIADELGEFMESTRELLDRIQLVKRHGTFGT